MKNKNFFYRVNPCEVLAEAIFAENKETWFMQFFNDLKNDDPEKAKLKIASDIISEAHRFRAKRSFAGKTSAQQKANKKQHILKDVVTHGQQTATSSSSSSSKEENIYKEIIDDLNLKGGFKYRVCENTKKQINGRISEGFKKEDFFHVHTVKIKDWKGDPEYEKYLCPDTLYRPSKFQKYVNQTAAPLTKKIMNQDGMVIEVPL